MNKTYLITGGAGFIGSHLVESLYEGEKNHIIVLDNLNPQIHGENSSSYTFNKIKDKCEFVHGDVKDEKLFKSLLKRANILIHFAAETGTGQSMYENAKYVENNCLATSYISDFLSNEKNSIEKVIVASSRSIYGEGKYECPEHGIQFPSSRKESDMKNKLFDCLCLMCQKPLKVLPTSEDSRIHPVSTYGLTKYFQENILESTCEALSTPLIALRFQNVYGVGQSLNNPYTGIISIFSNQLKENNPINIFEDGKESRDFIYISDVIDSIKKAINYKINKRLIINIGSGVQTSVIEVANVLKKNLHSKSKLIITGEFRKGDIRHNYADISNAIKILNFKPKVKISEGIKLFCEWRVKQDIDVNDNYSKSLIELKEKNLLS